MAGRLGPPYVGAVGILLLLLGVLAAASGALKLRGRARSLVGTSPLAVVEAVAGGLTVLGSGMGLARQRPLAWTVVGIVALVVVGSTTIHARRVAVHRRARRASEELRFTTYVRGETGPLRRAPGPPA
jgi:hypothetical protein